jgi:hypothetical protein
MCGLAAGMLLAAAPKATAQPEPHYLQALSELRTARDFIQYDKGAPGGDVRHHAVDEINKAIDEIKHAAWDDGKNTKFAPPAQGAGGWAPIHEAYHHVELARARVDEGVDGPQNNGLRGRIIMHLDESARALHHLLEMQIP